MRAIKNIVRLPRLYLPLLLTVIVTASAALLCAALDNSCNEAREKIENEYAVIVEISPKKQENKLSMDAVEHAGTIREAAGVEFFTKTFSYATQNMLTLAESEAVNSGNSFTLDIRNQHISVRGVTDYDLLDDVYGVESDKVHITRVSDEKGALLPYSIYERYKDGFVLGWHKAEAFISHEEEISDFAYETYARLPEPPNLFVSVVGYYTLDFVPKNELTIYADMETCKAIYKAADYYSTGNPIKREPQHYVRTDCDLMAEVGAEAILIALKEPSMAVSAVNALSAVIDSKEYNITADDYNYKYALSAVNSVAQFVRLFYIAIAVFGTVIVFALVRFALKKREKEIYILNSLGAKRMNTVKSFVTETALVLVAAVLLGLLFNVLFGNGIVELINKSEADKMSATAGRLSEVYKYMSGNEEMKLVLQKAQQAYTDTQITLSYRLIMPALIGVCAAALAVVVYAAVVIFIEVKKRGRL